MFDDPIKTIEQAKEIFVKMDGSTYEMARDFPDRQSEYVKLSVPKETERAWREEIFENLFDKIKNDKDLNEIWFVHSRMNRVFMDLETDRALLKMLEATEIIREKIPMKKRVLVAETINGRAARVAHSGLIYKAYDMDNIPAAKAFVELSLHFSIYDGQDTFSIERSRKAMELCNDIKMELGL